MKIRVPGYPLIKVTNFAAYSPTATAQVVKITPTVDVNGSLAGTYFNLFSANNATIYSVWLSITGATNPGTAPRFSAGSVTQVPVAFAQNSYSNAIAAALTTAINALNSTNDFSSVTTNGTANVQTVATQSATAGLPVQAAIRAVSSTQSISAAIQNKTAQVAVSAAVRSITSTSAVSAAIQESEANAPTPLTDYTTPANNATANDVPFFNGNTPVFGDAFYIGLAQAGGGVQVNVGTAAVGTYTLQWQYWNGTQWNSLTVTDNTTSFSVAGTNSITWTPPTDWATSSINSQGPFYYVRIAYISGSFTTAPLGTQLWQLKSHTDYTTAANNATANDVNFMNGTTPTAGDSFYIGFASQPNAAGFTINVGTAGAGTYTLTWQYWNGAWTNLSGVTDGTTSLKTVGTQSVTYTAPGDWVTYTFNNQGPFYYVRALYNSGTVTTSPLGTQLWNNTTSAYTDYTAAANNATANDVLIFSGTTPTAGDNFLFGFANPATAPEALNDLKVQIGTAGAGTYTGNVVWEYWNGTAWTTLTLTSDGTTAFSATAGTYEIIFANPTGWATSSPNAQGPYYYIRMRYVSGTVTTNPLLTQVWVNEGVTYTDQTAAANNATINDMNLTNGTTPAVDDAYYFGFTNLASSFNLVLGTAGAGTYSLVWEYYNGTGWQSITVTDASGSFKNVAGTYAVSWATPANWTTTTINSQGPYYYLRVRWVSGTVTTAPLGTQVFNTTGDANGSMNNKYFWIASPSNFKLFYVWLNVNSAGTDPKPGLPASFLQLNTQASTSYNSQIATTATGIMATVALNANANAIATAIAAAVTSGNTGGETSSSATNNVVTITWAHEGATFGTFDGNTGFTFATTTLGVSAFITITYKVNGRGYDCMDGGYPLIQGTPGSYLVGPGSAASRSIVAYLPTMFGFSTTTAGLNGLPTGATFFLIQGFTDSGNAAYQEGQDNTMYYVETPFARTPITVITQLVNIIEIIQD